MTPYDRCLYCERPLTVNDPTRFCCNACEGAWQAENASEEFRARSAGRIVRRMSKRQQEVNLRGVQNVLDALSEIYPVFPKRPTGK